MEIGGRDGDHDRRRAGRAADLERNGRSDLAAKRVDRAERLIAGRHDLVAEQNASLMRRRALDHPGYERPPPIVAFGEHANTGIGDVSAREDPVQAAMLERAGENIGELVIGRIVRCVVMGVGGAELRQHRIDDGRRIFARASGCGLRAEARALVLPVEAVEMGVVEAVAHELPDLVEVRLI